MREWDLEPFKKGDKCIFEDCDGFYIATALEDNEGRHPVNMEGIWGDTKFYKPNL